MTNTDTNKEREDFYAWLRTHEDEVGAVDEASAWVGFLGGRASLAASAGSEPVAWRAQFDAWWARNRVSTHQVKNIGGFAAKVWHAAIQTVVGATDSTAGFYPADDGSTPSRQAIHPSPPEGAGWKPLIEAPYDEMVLVAAEFDGPGDWRIKCGYLDKQTASWRVFGASWEPTRWMKMPAPPASEAKGA